MSTKYLILRDLKGTEFQYMVSNLAGMKAIPTKKVYLDIPVYRPKDDIVVIQNISCRVGVLSDVIKALRKRKKQAKVWAKTIPSAKDSPAKIDKLIKFLQHDYEQQHEIDE